MENDKKRKEVNLTQKTINAIQTAADKKKWSLKKMMEEVLTNYANRILNNKTLNND
jgi:hypothetical protein